MLYDVPLEEMRPLGLADSIPATAIFDKEGNRRFRMIGAVTREVLASRIEWLLRARTEEPPELTLPKGLTSEHFREHEEGREHEEHEAQPKREGQTGESGSTVPS
jgi:hypothetical protein